MNKFLLVFFFLLPFLYAQADHRKQLPKPITMEMFYEALGQVESGNKDDVVGDSGKSYGRYQIQKAYWKDAVEQDPGLKINRQWKEVVDKAYAEAIMTAYWTRYSKKELEDKNWEMLARVHNGGPKIMDKDEKSTRWKNTTKYWEKVSKELERLQNDHSKDVK